MTFPGGVPLVCLCLAVIAETRRGRYAWELRIVRKLGMTRTLGPPSGKH
jgi:hypothetical protein